MTLLILILCVGYIIWTITTEQPDGCENPDCDHCPFPKCKRGDK